MVRRNLWIPSLAWFLAGSVTHAGEYHVYFLGGQSNMDGYGQVADLPGDLQDPVDGVRIFHGNPAPDGRAVDGRGVWSELGPGHGAGFGSDGTTNSLSSRFGVELSFARRLRESAPGTRVALIKYSRGGTSIDQAAAGQAGCWEPDFEGGSGEGRGVNQYDHCLATLRHALSVRDIDGDGEEDVLVPKGILWMQGESDAYHSEEVARRYQANLKGLMNLLREALGDQHLPVAIGRISDSGQDADGTIWTHGEIVRAGQAAFVAQDGNAALVTSTDGYGYSDPYHYDSAGFLDLGRQFADALGGLQFTTLFDGESLDGWTLRNGTATYRVQDGAIVGRTVEGSPNSFLCTDRSYGDFELRFDVMVDNALNSGVQIRSQTRGGPQGRVNGPQVEIEASGASGAEAGYVYGEAAGGWMTPADQLLPHKHFRDGEWNAYRVLAVGANIQVWVNGTQVSDLTHEAKYRSHPRGFLGLQVHSVGRGSGPFEVRWRNLRIREVEGGFVPLYNGKDLSGWTTTGNWLPQEDGVLMIQPREGEQGWQRFDAYLWSERTYQDFILDLEYSYPEGGNSGVFFRVGDVTDPVDTGIEAQILDSSGKTGEMTHHDHGGIIRTVGAAKNMSRKPGEWNRMIVTCRGTRLHVVLNGEQIVDVDLATTESRDRPLEGYLGLQDHGEPHAIRFRHLWIKEL